MMETIRTLILVIGWPVLVGGSIFLVWRSIRFYRDIGKLIWGKLVLIMVVGWLVSMYSLGIVATAYMLDEVRNGVLVVLPIFFVWFVTMVLITWAVLRWSKEAVTLSAFYRGLEDVVRKRTEDLEKAYALRLQNEKEIRQLRERFVFIAAHELRAPVTTIKWGLDTLMRDESFQRSISEEERKLLEHLRSKNESLIELVNDLLRVARFQGKEETLQTEKVSLPEVLKQVEDNVRLLAQEREVMLSFPAAKRDLPFVKASITALNEVLTNLIVNAIRYNRRGGWVAVEAEPQSGDLVVQVKDSGIGMSEEEMEKLFQEFYRVESPETKDIEGTGLGLFISKKLLERMRGRIWVESEKGKGSTFSFSLPLYVPA